MLLLINNQGLCHTVPLPFTLKSIFRQNENYGSSNISPCTPKYKLQKILYKKPKILQDIITLN
jgi:hypothetical protein